MSAPVDPSSVHSPTVASGTLSITPEPTDTELECLYKELPGKPAILSLVSGFCNEYMYISQQVKRAPFHFHSLHFLMRKCWKQTIQRYWMCAKQCLVTSKSLLTKLRS